MALSITETETGGYRVLAVAGDLDLATAADLARAAVKLIGAGARDIIVDARDLTFCDSAGLTAFVQIANLLEPQDGRLAIAGARAIVLRVLEVSGLVEVVIVAETVSKVIAELSATP
jgi:anti-anti-sigma factor